MKRLYVALLICLFTAAPIFANVNADIYGVWLDANEMKTQTGFGLNLGYGINDQFNILLKFIESSTVENENTTSEVEYGQTLMLAGIEYLYPIKRTRFVWKSGVFAGRAEHKAEPVSFEETSDSGLCLMVTTGGLFDLTQRIAFICDIGYHYPIYSKGELESVDLNGFNVQFGFRFSLYDRKNVSYGY